MKTTNATSVVHLYLLATTALVPASLFAQETAPVEEGYLGELVLLQSYEDPAVEGYVAQTSSSATKTSASLVTTPMTVNVVTSDQIAEQGAESVAEALSYTPNVVTNYRGESTIYDETFIRGYTYAPKYLNGAQFGTSGFGQLDPYLLERIEVVKGPNSVTFGQSIPGGVVNMAMKTPNNASTNKVSLGFGSDNLMQISTDLNGSLNEDGTLKYRVAATAWTKDLEGDDFGQTRVAISPSLTWDITPDTQLEVDVTYQHDPEAGQRNFMTKLGTLEATTGGYYYDSDSMSIAPEYDNLERETWSVGARFRHTFDNGMTYRSSLRYTDIEQLHNGVYIDRISDDIATLGVVWIEDDYTQFTFDNSLETSFDLGASSHQILTGIDYQRQTELETNRTDWSTDLTYDLSDPEYITLDDDPDQYLTDGSVTDTVSEQTGIYLQDQVSFGNLSLMLGARYDWTSTTEEDVTDGGSDTATASAASWRAGLVYEFPNGVVSYASYATSFDPSTNRDVNGDLLETSTARQYEAGLKWASPDERILLTAAYFDIEQTNIGEVDPDNGWPYYVNIGTRRSKGIELEAKADVTDRLSIIAAYGKVDAEMTEGEYEGYAASRIPKSTASLWAKYELFDGFSSSFGVRHTGESYGDNTEDTVVPSYTLYDLGMNADLGSFFSAMEGATATLAVSNVTDETYVASCASGYYCWYGEGREFRFNISYEW